MLNEKGLRSQPVWSIEETGLENELKQIQSSWKTILHEVLMVLDLQAGGFTKYPEEINDSGYWDHFSLFSHGKKQEKNCLQMPSTCFLIEKFPEITKNDFGQVTIRFHLVDVLVLRTSFEHDL